MRYLYADNFRGFSNAFVPIADVSFLVGENSTGKTSILSLARILGTPNFWLGLDFDTEDIKLGHFRDLVSVNAKDKSFFRVGFFEIRAPRNGDKQTVHAALLTFTEKNGMPELSDYSFSTGDSLVSTKFVGKRVFYRVTEVAQIATGRSLVPEVFKRWCEDHSGGRRGMAPLEGSKRFSGIPKIFDVFYRIEQELAKAKHRPRGFSPPQFAADLVWLAPIRSKPRRTYDEYKFEFSAEGEHTPYLIRKILSSRSEATKFKAFLERMGKETGLFESIAVRRYGRLATSPFELDVILNKQALSVSNVGYGVSQALPVLVEMFARAKAAWFAIQQPEVHLHPRAQAAMGDAIHELVMREQKSFLVETHSDYLIDHFRMSLKNGRKKCSAQVLYFERNENGNNVHVLPIADDGELPLEQPKGYRGFFVREQLRVLGLENVHSD
jgi:hypothetical protein